MTDNHRDVECVSYFSMIRRSPTGNHLTTDVLIVSVTLTGVVNLSAKVERE
jgi:hypothetical protein